MLSAAIAAAAASVLLAEPLPPGFIRGMNFAHVHAPGFGYGSERSKKECERLRAIGVDWIALSPFAYQPRVDQPDLRFGGGDRTLTDRHLLAAIADAHAVGLKVLLKPHIWSNQFWDRGKWHGDIAMANETDADLWFERYGAYLVQTAEIAERGRAEALSIGLEYVRMTGPEHTARWRKLIARVRRVFSGALTYGAHHDGEALRIGFWDALDWIGVHAYWPLPEALERDGVSPGAIATALAPRLEELRPLSERMRKPVVLTEIGFPSHSGALREPWRSDGKRPSDEALQARAYEGALIAAGRTKHVRGLFFWKWFSGGSKNPFESDPYEPCGKMAERVLERFYAKPAASIGSPKRPR